MTPYRHEQVGQYLIYSVIAVGLLVMLYWGSGALPSWAAVALVAVLAVLGLSFIRLRIDVDRTRIAWGMTYGWPGGEIPIDDVRSAQIVPVTFWMGIGIHLTLRGWLWNVARGRGVQIERFSAFPPIVLGTDDPEGLLAAIEAARAP